MKANAAFDPVELLIEARVSKHQEAYQTLEKTVNYRIGVGVRVAAPNQPHFFLEILTYLAAGDDRVIYSPEKERFCFGTCANPAFFNDLPRQQLYLLRKGKLSRTTPSRIQLGQETPEENLQEIKQTPRKTETRHQTCTTKQETNAPTSTTTAKSNYKHKQNQKTSKTPQSTKL